MTRRRGTVDRSAGRGRRPSGRAAPVLRAGLPTALLAVLLAGCGSSVSAGPDAGTASTAASSAAPPPSIPPAPSTVTSTVTSTSTPPGITAQAPPATDEPGPVDGSCPYLTDLQVEDINGQHTGQTQVIEVAPHPVCVFIRSDGGWLATVRVIEAATPAEAVAAVDQHVPIDTSSPATQPAGWSGGAAVLDDRSVYAVAKDRFAVVAESNQLQTIKGRQMAITTISALAL